MIPIRNKKTLQVTVEEMRKFAFSYVEKYAPSKQQLKTYLLKKYLKNAKLSRLHNDANVITLGERLISKNLAFKCISAFLNTKFEGGRHLKRVKKI